MRISDWSSDVCSSDLQPLAPVILGREVHLVPDLLIFRRVAADQEARKVLFHDVRGGFATRGDSGADRAVLRLAFDHQRAEHVDAEALPRLARKSTRLNSSN